MSSMVLRSFLSVFFFLLIASPATNAAVELSGVKNPGCKKTCGNLTVPYPFGIGIECAANPQLYITCNYTAADTPIPYIRDGNIEVVNISESEVHVKNFVGYMCYNNYGNLTNISESYMYLPSSYTFSSERNKFFSTGCNTIASILGGNEENYASSCVSWCTDKKSIQNGSCSGIACCQTSIPTRLNFYAAYLNAADLPWEGASWGFTVCSYAFLADSTKFKFLASDLTDLNFYNKTMEHVPVVLDWVIENRTCEETKKRGIFACHRNSSVCVDSKNTPGYRCKCKDGYKGNPYMEIGCSQDINECADTTNNACVFPSTCKNTPGNFTCTCLHGTHGDGRNDGEGCQPKKKEFPTLKVILGTGLGILFLLIGSFWLYSGLKKRRLVKLKQRFFKQNGGLLLLQQQISSHKNGRATRIYTAEELEKATNNYDESHIIGRGGNGTVYKGVLAPDNKIIAIKKSKVVDGTQIEQFINELAILTQINHKNVVKLLGCCLETEVPLLVYEFISNGTLYHHIHSQPTSGTVSSKYSWYNCLRIATEVSRALAYLHSAASIPIIHRDVKSTNILLDDNYSAKVADFGASRLIPLDQTQVSTIIQGTLGYLDPESYQTGMLTEKSDVYSFGIVLTEILTGKTPLSLDKSDVCRSLATYFTSAMRENAILQIVDDRLVDEADREQLYAVAALAMKCLAWTGKERPTMKNVLEELEGLMKLAEQHPWAQENTEETMSLLDDHSDLYPRATFSVSIGESSGQYSMNLNNSLMSPLNLPR